MFDYYKNWDKFTKEEVDKADDEPEGDFIPATQPEALEQPKPTSQAEMLKRTSGARPNTKMVIKGGTIKQSSQADTLKLQGNAFFLSLEYDRAIDCYTRCLAHIDESNHQLFCVVYSNRAQCQIKLKKYETAFQDASQALSHDPNHMKSIQRRGTSAYYTNRLRVARKDFTHSLSIDFSTQIAEYLIKVNKGIEKVKFEAYEKLKR